MGRWAQRRVRGGGPELGATVAITAAVHFLTHLVTLTYSADVTATDFPATSFFLTPGGQVSTTITQVGSNQIRVTFGGANINIGDVIHYGGGNPNVVSPDSFVIA